MLQSGWSCVGLVRHLAVDVERFWFRAVVAGEQVVIDEIAGDASQVSPDVNTRSVFDSYLREIDRANEIIVATPLDTEPAWLPDALFEDWRLDDLGGVLLHVITETACPAGHLDAVRELIDGRRLLVLTE